VEGTDDAGGQDMALRLLQRLSLDPKACITFWMARAFLTAGQLMLQPSKGFLEALLEGVPMCARCCPLACPGCPARFGATWLLCVAHILCRMFSDFAGCARHAQGVSKMLHMQARNLMCGLGGC
jgi:hypothetical protein